MARLTLGEQLTQLAEDHRKLQTELATAQVAVTQHLAANEQLQLEVSRLYPLQEKVNTQAAKIEDLEKKLKEKESSYSYKSTELQKAEAEIEQAHAVLDGIPGAPEREYEITTGYGSRGQRNVVTRLAGVFLAIAQKTPSAVQ